MEGVGQGQSFREELPEGSVNQIGLRMGQRGRGKQGKCLLKVGPEEGGAYRASFLLGATGGNLLT